MWMQLHLIVFFGGARKAASGDARYFRLIIRWPNLHSLILLRIPTEYIIKRRDNPHFEKMQVFVRSETTKFARREGLRPQLGFKKGVWGQVLFFDILPPRNVQLGRARRDSTIIRRPNIHNLILLRISA